MKNDLIVQSSILALVARAETEQLRAESECLLEFKTTETTFPSF